MRKSSAAARGQGKNSSLIAWWQRSGLALHDRTNCVTESTAAIRAGACCNRLRERSQAAQGARGEARGQDDGARRLAAHRGRRGSHRAGAACLRATGARAAGRRDHSQARVHVRAALGGRSKGERARRVARHEDSYFAEAPAHRPEDRRPARIHPRHADARHGLRHWTGGYGQDLPRDGDGDLRAQKRAGHAHHPHAPGGRGRRSARLFARRFEGKDHALPPAALRRALRHARS